MDERVHFGEDVTGVAHVAHRDLLEEDLGVDVLLALE